MAYRGKRAGPIGDSLGNGGFRSSYVAKGHETSRVGKPPNSAYPKTSQRFNSYYVSRILEDEMGYFSGFQVKDVFYDHTHDFLSVTFNSPIDILSALGWSATIAGNAAPIAVISVGLDPFVGHFAFTGTPPTFIETITLSYDSAVGNSVDREGNSLKDYSNDDVTHNGNLVPNSSFNGGSGSVGTGDWIPPDGWVNAFWPPNAAEYVEIDLAVNSIRFQVAANRGYLQRAIDTTGLVGQRINLSVYLDAVVTNTSQRMAHITGGVTELRQMEAGLAPGRYDAVYEITGTSIQVRVGSGTTSNTDQDITLSRVQLVIGEELLPYIPTFVQTEAPVVDAGGPYEGVVNTPIALSGAVIPGQDDPSPTIEWSIVLGGTGTFGDDSSPTTTFTPDLEGEYVLGLTATPSIGDPVSSVTTLESLKNFTTMDPNKKNAILILSEKNLRCVSNSTSGRGAALSTFGATTGKYYWEALSLSAVSAQGVGIGTSGTNLGEYLGSNAFSWGYFPTGAYWTNAVNQGTGTPYGVNSILGFALDTAGNLDVYVNGVLSFSVPHNLTGPIFAGLSDSSTGGVCDWMMNFGQDSSFGGRQTAQDNPDDNGVGDYYYVPPAGYLTLIASD